MSETTPDQEQSLLERLRTERWKLGVRCPRCKGARCGVHARSGAGRRRKLWCSDCARTFNDLTGTPLARSHLPLTSWAEAARLMRDGEPTCAALARRLKVKVATAWRVRRILRRALADPLLAKVLQGDPS